MLIKPGPAIATSVTNFNCFNSSSKISANFLGGMPHTLDKTIAAFVANSTHVQDFLGALLQHFQKIHLMAKHFVPAKNEECLRFVPKYTKQFMLLIRSKLYSTLLSIKYDTGPILGDKKDVEAFFVVFWKNYQTTDKPANDSSLAPLPSGSSIKAPLSMTCQFPCYERLIQPLGTNFNPSRSL